MKGLIRTGLLCTAMGPGLLLGCQSPEPRVEVQTFVGDRFTRSDPEIRRETTAEILEVALSEFWGRMRARSAVAASNEGPRLAQTVHPPRTTQQLEDLVAAIRKGPIDELGGPARRIGRADPSVWPELRRRLLAERKAPKGDYEAVLKVIGGDTPNRYGHFALQWKQNHGYDVQRSEDWFEDLLAIPRGRISAMLLPVYRDCVLQTAMLQAAREIGRDPNYTASVVQTLHETAFAHHGLFRDEVSRALVALGDEAIPHLIALSIAEFEGDEERFDPEVMAVRFARNILDSMDRLHPQRAVEAVQHDPRLTEAVLRAYGDAKLGEAAEILLDHVDHRSVAVRTAARNAFEAYVTGPAPRVVKRTVRLLGGETTQARAFLTHRQRAWQAIRSRLEAEAPDLLEPECELIQEDGSTDETCEAQPARLTETYFGWLDARRSETERRAIDEALAHADPDQGAEMIDRLLAMNPELGSAADEGSDPGSDQVERIARFFRKLADDRQAAGSHARAGQLYRKSAMLLAERDEAVARQLRIAALLAEASVEGLDPNGQAMLLRTARELDPSSSTVARALEQLDSPSTTDDADTPRLQRWVGASALFSAVLGFLGILGAIRRR